MKKLAKYIHCSIFQLSSIKQTHTHNTQWFIAKSIDAALNKLHVLENILAIDQLGAFHYRLKHWLKPAAKTQIDRPAAVRQMLLISSLVNRSTCLLN